MNGPFSRFKDRMFVNGVFFCKPSKRSRVSCSCVSSIESNHAIHFCSKSMHARFQCLSLILTGMSILEHVNMSTYLVSLGPRISPSSTYFQKNGVAKKVLR